ncbi:hypothetical protein [Streptomyces sp. SID12488]|uniref:hypothetical protein n=1 Tax=Streptomyces sp. SID12488 TaxID=2706040 RepID=UPI001EF3A2AC|nr:hypothetical protein [Streptomyces sp. SID12488]
MIHVKPYSQTLWRTALLGFEKLVGVLDRAMCGDDTAALHVVGGLVRDVGGIPATLGHWIASASWRR